MDILKEGLQVTVIGMGLVFFVLICLMYVLKLFTVFLNKKEIKSDKDKIEIMARKEKTKIKENLQEEIAVITAAMLEVLEENETIININPIK
ncbi:MAG: OadG family protein [Bacillota bacterium]